MVLPCGPGARPRHDRRGGRIFAAEDVSSGGATDRGRSDPPSTPGIYLPLALVDVAGSVTTGCTTAGSTPPLRSTLPGSRIPLGERVPNLVKRAEKLENPMQSMRNCSIGAPYGRMEIQNDQQLKAPNPCQVTY
jgi:hypothetical protein